MFKLLYPTKHKNQQRRNETEYKEQYQAKKENLKNELAKISIKEEELNIALNALKFKHAELKSLQKLVLQKEGELNNAETIAERVDNELSEIKNNVESLEKGLVLKEEDDELFKFLFPTKYKNRQKRREAAMSL